MTDSSIARAGEQFPPPSNLTASETMSWLLDDFVERTPGVTHALIGSKDGIRLLASKNMNRDWADELAAVLSGHASLAAGTQGPFGKSQPRQIMIECGEHLLLIMVSGNGYRAAFPDYPDDTHARVDTLLGVFIDLKADAGMVGFQMQRLIKAFPRHMETQVRTELNASSTDGSHAGIR